MKCASSTKVKSHAWIRNIEYQDLEKDAWIGHVNFGTEIIKTNDSYHSLFSSSKEIFMTTQPNLS